MMLDEKSLSKFTLLGYTKDIPVEEEQKQGDIIKLDLTPTKGHEQAGYRPALVVSNASFSQASHMRMVCPITNTNRNSPLHVALNGLQTTGFVMCDQVRVVDIRTRGYKVVESISEDTLWEVCDIIIGSVDVQD